MQERTLLNKREVDHKIEEKIQDIEFNKGEIDRQRKEVCKEIDCLNLYKERIMDALASLKDQALKICKQCLMYREGRLGIDLVIYVHLLTVSRNFLNSLLVSRRRRT